MSKSKRTEIAKDTLQIIDNGYFGNADGTRIEIADLQDFTEQNTKLYSPGELNELIKISPSENQKYSETTYEVTGETTLDAVRRLAAKGEEKILCLNFASARNPGGGFLGGAQAQEESIARSSGLYPTLLSCSEYYEINRANRSTLYTDHMIYSPEVPIFKLENGENMENVITCSVITSPAPNAGAIKRNEPQHLSKIESVFRNRINGVLAISESRGYETLVLGAWGCGVFQNDPREVALWFEDALKGKYERQFKRIVFAVYSRNERFITPFRERFKN